MSTRVQKGGPIFKPTLKPRPQTTHEYPTISNVQSVQQSAPPMQPIIFPMQPVLPPVRPTLPSMQPPLPPSMQPILPPPMQPTLPPPMQPTLPSMQAAAQPVQPNVHPVQSTRQKTVKKSRRSRAPSLAPLDPAADPGENIDPTVVTMAALCSDTGRGRVSSKASIIQDNHAAWRVSNRERRARMKVIMEAKKFGRNDEAECSTRNATENGQNSVPVTSAGSISTAPILNGGQGGGPSAIDESGHGFDYSQTLATSRFNVQIRIGPNGETIVDEESLFVDRNDEENTDSYTHVEESDNTKFINSGSFGKRYRGSRWSAEETELFYDAVSQFGENYELISFVLPGRDRKSCKNKFKAEDKKNPGRITHCLNNRIPYDIQTLSRMTGKDFSGPTPVIRAPTPLTLNRPESTENTAESIETTGQLSKQGFSGSAAADMDEVIVGDAESFDP